VELQERKCFVSPDRCWLSMRYSFCDIFHAERRYKMYVQYINTLILEYICYVRIALGVQTYYLSSNMVSVHVFVIARDFFIFCSVRFIIFTDIVISKGYDPRN